MPERHAIRVFIGDDEPLGRERIQHLLEAEPGVIVVGQAADGEAAVQGIRRLDPDLVFLDIQMPGRTGLEVVREIGPNEMPATIFVTAFDDFALQGFELSAVDYLVKPFSDERFEEAFRRARHRIELEDLDTARNQLRSLLEDGQLSEAPPSAPTSSPYLKRIAVRKRGQTRVVPVTDIRYISASGVYVELHAGAESHLVRASLRTLERQLDPEHFFRIHRTGMVQLDQVEFLLKEGGGNYQVQLRTGEKLPVGRSRLEELERRLGRIETDR